MVNLIRAELYKLRKDRSFRVLLLILGCFALAYPLLVYYDNLSDGSVEPGATFMLGAIEFNAYIVKLAAAVLAGFFIAGEYTTGVMKTIASSGSARGKLFAAKLIGFAVGAMALAVVLPIVSTLVDTMLVGFGRLPAEFPDLYVLRTFGLTLLYAAAYASISALFTTMLTESGKTIGFTIIFFLLIDSILTNLARFVPFLQTVYDYSVFKLLNDTVDPDFGTGSAAAIILVPLFTIAVSGLLGYLVYRRKEIK